MAEEQEKIYKIKIPVYVSELVKRDRQALFQTTYDDLISDAKSMISNYNNSTQKTKCDQRSKTTTICIEEIDPQDISFNQDKCLLLKVTAFKTNLIDGYYQSGKTHEEIHFQTNDKLCSDNYFFILYPMINPNTKTNTDEVYWHIFIYEDPSKANEEMSKIAKAIMRDVLKVPIKNIKSEKFIEDLRRCKSIPKVEITLSSLDLDDSEELPTYLRDYTFTSTLKKEKKITIDEMDAEDAIEIFNDTSFTTGFKKRQIKYYTPNKRMLSALQEYKENMTLSLEDSFNYSIEVHEKEMNHIFEIDTIKKNIQGVFSNYLNSFEDD